MQQPLLSELKDRAGDMYKPSPAFQKIDAKNAKDPASKVTGMPPNYGEFLVPHVVSFVGVLSSMARVYRAPDEAIKHSQDNARFMRNDISVMESIEQRQRSCALLDWHIEADDEKDQTQVWLAGEMEDILALTPKFMQYRENLLHALWYGKYGVQSRYVWKRTTKGMRLCVGGWAPVNGDKIVFRYDDGSHQYLEDHIGIRVGAGIFAGDKIAGAWAAERMKKVEATDYGLAYFLEPWERPLLAIHKHYIEDGEYEEPISAGKIHGVGIRSRIYWSWYQKQEALAWLMEFLERSAFGLELWYYPYGNSEAEAKARTAAQERIGGGRNIILVPRPVDDSGNMYGVEVIERNMAGAEVLKDILHSYFGHQIKRYILGQTLTTEADSTGLGSNLASIHLDTYLQIVRYDATNLEETITEELLRPLMRFNFPKYAHLPLRFKIETESPDVQAKLESFEKAWNMGLSLPAKAVYDMIGLDPPQEDEDKLDNPTIKQQERLYAQAEAGGVLGGGQQMPGAAPGTEEYGRAQVQGGLGEPEPVVDQLTELLGGNGEAVEEEDPKELALGIQTEMEHTSDPAMAMQIAKEHLAEDPTYYSQLVECGIIEPKGDGGDRERASEFYRKAVNHYKIRGYAAKDITPLAIGMTLQYNNTAKVKHLSEYLNRQGYSKDATEYIAGACVYRGIDEAVGVVAAWDDAEHAYTAELRGHLEKYAKSFDESKHPRGQPDNAGEFGPGGGETPQEGDGGQPKPEAPKKPRGPMLSSLSKKPTGGPTLYRGTRPGSRGETYSFWTPEKQYALEYGDKLDAAYLKPDATILDLTELIKDGDIDGANLDEAVPGLADALGIDNETVIEANRLWDAAGDDLAKAAGLLRQAGYHGFRWIENEGNEAYLLLHDPANPDIRYSAERYAKSFDESEHPRADSGEFAEKEGGGTAKAKSFSTIREAANELQAIRDDMASAIPDDDLESRVDAVGQWAAKQKTGKAIMGILEEAHQIHDRLHGGSGKKGLRIDLPESPAPAAEKGKGEGDKPQGQKRAAVGGELGPNGEWYKGGAFIATTEMPKKLREKRDKAAADKEDIEPGKREVPEPGKLSIFRALGPYFNWRTGEVEPAPSDYADNKQDLPALKELAKRYVAGERYADVADYPQLARFSDMARMAKADMPIPGEALERMAGYRGMDVDGLKTALGVAKYKPKANEPAKPEPKPDSESLPSATPGQLFSTSEDTRQAEFAPEPNPQAPAVKRAVKPLPGQAGLFEGFDVRQKGKPQEQKSLFGKWTVAEQMKYHAFGIHPKHVVEAFWAHGANGEIVQEEGDKVFRYTRVGGAVSCERYVKPVRYGQSFDESQHPRGQPENAGRFVEGNETKPSVKDTVDAVTAGTLSGTAAKKLMKAAGLHNEYLAAMKAARAPAKTPVEDAETAKARREHEAAAMQSLATEAKRGASPELHPFIDSAAEFYLGDDSVSVAKLLQTAHEDQDEEEERRDRIASEKEAADAAYAEWSAKKDATRKATGEVDSVFSPQGYVVEYTNASATGSHYFDLKKGDEVVTLRISDHHAPAGSGWNEQTQEYHSTPDVNVVVVPGEPVDWKTALAQVEEIYKERAEG